MQEGWLHVSQEKSHVAPGHSLIRAVTQVLIHESRHALASFVAGMGTVPPSGPTRDHPSTVPRPRRPGA